MNRLQAKPARTKLPVSWRPVVAEELRKPYFHKLEEFLRRERQEHEVYPPEDEVFTALKATPFKDVNVLLLGQDPYHDENQAHGLAFSVRPGIRPPPSLMNIFRELRSDLGWRIPNNGYLMPWARQGVLLLNAVLTVRAHAPNSHRNKGWEEFTDTIIQRVAEKDSPVVFLLWGAYAQKKAALVDPAKDIIISSAHPSPLSAMHGFFGSKPFSRTNRALEAAGKRPINWQIPDL
jgi:uracil-DNA glycosylase